ncbi:MAG: hypothetical protein J7623_15915 [Chitinophaga sp.]|uniref:hypothetical protein n=1 Tax=Chitinophaga sp. TaxID=1869181 RepID=UPI001B18B0A0|nr:hypothetical protein [Chitinophaga sp.]MBO9730125.1 hypothetical protein [Chitinophaga sp.]
MKCFLSALVLVFFVISSTAQNVYQIKADSVRIYNSCDTAELILENRTQNVSGFLFNKANGRTEFRRLQLKAVNNALAIVGQDTLALSPLVKGSGDSLYIWQQSAVSQPLSSFWISGTGRAGAFMTNNTINSPHTVMLKPGGSTSRWATFLYNAETGTGNKGSDFRLARYSDSGTFVANVITIERASGIVTMSEGLRTVGNVGINMPAAPFKLSVSDTVNVKYMPQYVRESYPLGTMLGLYNTVGADSIYSGVCMQGINGAGLYQSAYLGLVTTPGTTYQGNIVIGQRTGDKVYGERMRIVGSTGYVGIGTTTPVAQLDVNGALRIANVKNNASGDSILTTDANGVVKLKSPVIGIAPINVISSSVTLGQNDYTTIINNSAAVTVNLPAAASNKGRIYNIKKISNNTFNITIQAQGADLIENGASFVFNTYLKSVQIQSSGTVWYIIN